jgi:hypothetical protein
VKENINHRDVVNYAASIPEYKDAVVLKNEELKGIN